MKAGAAARKLDDDVAADDDEDALGEGVCSFSLLHTAPFLM